MSINLICRATNVAEACNVGSPPEVTYVQFAVHGDAMEAWLREGKANKYEHRCVLGVLESTAEVAKETD